MTFRTDDLDLVAVFEFRQNRRDPPVDFRADGRVAELGVHRIGEIDRRRPTRQGDKPAFGREAEDLILK